MVPIHVCRILVLVKTVMYLTISTLGKIFSRQYFPAKNRIKHFMHEMLNPYFFKIRKVLPAELAQRVTASRYCHWLRTFQLTT